jgi:hypothetical protein
MFVDIVQSRRTKLGQDSALRLVFLKPHGIVHGRFVIRVDLPKHLKVGVFAMGRRPAWVRFSSDTLPTTPDLRTTCGIKLFGVPGGELLDDGDTQDFIVQNYDIFFVDTARDMCEFIRAGVVEGDYDPCLRAHPATDRILKEMAKVGASVLAATYWSVLPYAFGNGRCVTCNLEPETPPDEPPPDDPDFLAADLEWRLRAGEARFRFMALFRTDPATMPLGQTTVRW